MCGDWGETKMTICKLGGAVGMSRGTQPSMITKPLRCDKNCWFGY